VATKNPGYLTLQSLVLNLSQLVVAVVLSQQRDLHFAFDGANAFDHAYSLMLTQN